MAVIDQATVDRRRRLVLIRRDNVEHLLIIGGPRDVVVEQNIVRAATALRGTGPARPPAMPRVPLGEDSMWPLQPEAAPPGAPAPRKARTTDPRAQLADALSRVPGVEHRRPPRLQPAPPARSTADAALKPATDQNLSEMAQRLEATLRRPAKSSDDARTAAGSPKTTGEQSAPEPFAAAPPFARLDTMLRRPFRADEPRAPSGAPKAPSEPAASPREPDTQGRDDKAPSEPTAAPRQSETQGRGDDVPAAPPPDPETQAVAMTRASPQRRRENRTRRAVAIRSEYEIVYSDRSTDHGVWFRRILVRVRRLCERGAGREGRIVGALNIDGIPVTR